MTLYQIIRAAIPEASEDLCELILWSLTPFFAVGSRQSPYIVPRVVFDGRRGICAITVSDGLCPGSIYADGVESLSAEAHKNRSQPRFNDNRIVIVKPLHRSAAALPCNVLAS